MTTASSAQGSARDRTGVLVFEAVSKRFARSMRTHRTIDALREVTFTLGPQEIVGIIGPNGAGKSTILKLAAGISAPTTGIVRRRGHTLCVIELGAGIHPDLTGRENLELLSSLSARPGADPSRARDEMVAFSGLSDVLDLPTRTYSTGMVARLAFSVAAHSEPDLLLLDEVLSVGDLDFQRQCRSRIFELRDQGTTVGVVSHDLHLVAGTCERSILIIDGSIEQDGDTEDVVRHYQGLPPQVDEGHVLHLAVASSTMRTGDQLEASLQIPTDITYARIRFDLVTYPPQLASQGISIIIGTTSVTTSATGPLEASLPTLDLPVGRYELHVTLEDAAHRALMTDSTPFNLVGSGGPPIIRLRHDARLDGIAVAP